MSEQKLLIQDTITAATTQTLAGARASTAGANLSAKADVHIISTCANAGDAVALPVADTSLSGSVKIIKNEGAAICAIYPDTGGVITCLGIGALSANAAFDLDPKHYVKLHTSDGKNWRVLDRSENRIEVIPDEDLPVALSESGKTFLLPQATAARVITLPAPTAGAKYTFKVLGDTAGSDDGFDWTITSTGTLIKGRTAITVAAAAEATFDLNATSVDFDHLANAGSTWELESDGTNWLAIGTGGVTGTLRFVA